MQIILEDDLVDSCKPGTRISVVGVYKTIPPRAVGQIGGLFKAVVVGNSVRQLSKEASRDLTADDIRYGCVLLNFKVKGSLRAVHAFMVCACKLCYAHRC